MVGASGLMVPLTLKGDFSPIMPERSTFAKAFGSEERPLILPPTSCSAIFAGGSIDLSVRERPAFSRTIDPISMGNAVELASTPVDDLGPDEAVSATGADVAAPGVEGSALGEVVATDVGGSSAVGVVPAAAVEVCADGEEGS